MATERRAAAERFMRSRGMAATDEWLTGCIDYFCQQTPGGSVLDLLAMVNSQWTLSDLRDMSPGCLPRGLCATVKTQLNGLYALQMNSLIDIGSPAYKQWQEIKKIDTANVEVTQYENKDPPIQRLLKLSLTDGVQNIHAIEYRPMRNLSSSLTPGIKIQIKGPIDCRRGVLILEEKHVTVLGGEVDDLIETNSYSNNIRRKINIDKSSADIPTFTREPVRINPDNQNSVMRNPPPNNIAHATSYTDDDLQLNADMFEDVNFDIAELEAIENTVVNANATASREINRRSVDRIESYPFSRSSNNSSMLVDYPVSTNDSFENYTPVANGEFSPPMSLGTPSTAARRFPIHANKDPYVYIKQLIALPEDVTLGKVFVLKAQIYKVVGKLSLQKTSWTLRCTLIDGSGGLNVDVESEVLSKIIGYTPEDMIKLKKQMASNPSLKQKLMEALDSAMNKIQNLDCLFHIVYKSSIPQVFKIEEVKQVHILKLKESLSAAL